MLKQFLTVAFVAALTAVPLASFGQCSGQTSFFASPTGTGAACTSMQPCSLATMQTQMESALSSSLCPTGNLVGNPASASFVGSIDNGTAGQAGTTLHVSGVSGTIQIGDMISGAAPGGGVNPPPWGVIVSGSGSTWTISNSEAVSAQAMTSYTPLVYPLGATLALGSSDSGSAACTVTWQSASGQYAALSGGVAVTGFSLCSTSGAPCQGGSAGVYSASVAGLSPSREIFVNNVRYPRAHGAAYPSGWTIGSTTLTAPSSSGCSSSSVAGCSNPTQVEIDIQTSFTEADCYVASVSGTTVTPSSSCYSNFQNTITTSAAVSQVSNAPELLTSANCPSGCFYWSQSTNTLYVLPISGVSMASAAVYVPQLEQVLSGSGASYLEFSRLVFEHAAMETFDNANGFVTAFLNGICPGSGCNESYGYPYYDTMPAAIEFTNSSNHITFSHDAIVRNAGRGLWAEHSSQTFLVVDGLFSDNGAGAIQYGDYYDPNQTNSALQTDALTFENNVHDAARQYYTVAEIVAPYFTNSTFEHNTGYDDNTPGGFLNTVYHLDLDIGSYSAGNAVTDNSVTWYAQGSPFGPFADSGALHVAGNTGLTATGNYFFHGAYGNCLYLDNGTSNDTASGNVCDTLVGSYVKVNGGTGNTEANNCSTTSTYGLFAGGGNAPTGTTLFTSGSPPSNCASIINAAGIQSGVTPGP
jgi:hypothetical protein